MGVVLLAAIVGAGVGTQLRIAQLQSREDRCVASLRERYPHSDRALLRYFCAPPERPTRK